MIGAYAGVTVRDVLELEAMRGTTVLAGRSGLDRLVTGVNVMEVPDIVDWVKPRELLVTTGFPLVGGDQQSTGVSFARLVRDMHARDLSGIGIKLGRYVDSIDPAVLALGDDLDFPVLGLPMALGFDDLLRETYARLAAHTEGIWQRVDALNEALSLLVLGGGSLDQIAAEVAKVLGLGVVITSTDGRERAAALTETMRSVLARSGLLGSSGRFRVERVGPDPTRVGDGQVRRQPIVAGGTDLARLVCVSLDRPLTSEDTFAMERAATVAALLLTKQEAVAAVESKYRGDFLRDVFLGRAGDRAYVVEHAASLGWDLDSPTYVISAELDPAAEDEATEPVGIRRGWQERFARAWRQVCAFERPVVPIVDFTAEVVALFPAELGREGLARLVATVRGDRGGGRRPFSTGVSRLVTSPDQLPDAYLQARRASEAGRRIGGGGGTTWFDDLGVHRLIALIPAADEVRAFALDVLGELAEETDEAADLRTTLQLLLDTNLNVAEAARRQFFHYNTMRYRVTKLERILGPFTSDPHLRLDVAVALQVRTMRI